ncbi:MAG: putative PhzF superfamily epimerase YddE/YHI9 [Cellvibrionaceae bacterium]|jgi:predicted PhzF superfamily epimerase YddE/YHI9
MSATDFTLFHVFTSDFAGGNSAAVKLVNKLPTFEEHLKFSAPCKTRVYICSNSNSPHFDFFWDIRWLNDSGSVKRCGHGTLAAAAFLREIEKNNTFNFFSESEKLQVKVDNNGYSLILTTVDLLKKSKKLLPFSCRRFSITEDFQGYCIAELENEIAVRQFVLHQQIIDFIGRRALIVSAKSKKKNMDLTFRYFAPQYDNFEDSATGSAAAILWPFWQAQFENRWLNCYQASEKRGYYQLMGENEKVKVRGQVEKLKICKS